MWTSLDTCHCLLLCEPLGAGRITSCEHPTAALKMDNDASELLFFGLIWGQTFNPLDDTLALDGDHLSEEGFGALRAAAAQMAFATLGPHQRPRPGQAKPFGGCLMGLQFDFCFQLPWHSETPLDMI